ncbi:hypothetical protein DAEQUDRAFT_370188 [Daedalea quercina L-15889]|uniref:Uncharacterized protein n=1 Tax=Daedalea quercina L-15889 TaxID=1314783 RepID=A0A165PB17_9APHY|nr:hypothetical protein DAEQUDRAFT_370188 [Daedalea quercina L-15889]
MRHATHLATTSLLGRLFDGWAWARERGHNDIGCGRQRTRSPPRRNPTGSERVHNVADQLTAVGLTDGDRPQQCRTRYWYSNGPWGTHANGPRIRQLVTGCVSCRPAKTYAVGTWMVVDAPWAVTSVNPDASCLRCARSNHDMHWQVLHRPVAVASPRRCPCPPHCPLPLSASDLSTRAADSV